MLRLPAGMNRDRDLDAALLAYTNVPFSCVRARANTRIPRAAVLCADGREVQDWTTTNRRQAMVQTSCR